jgi:hypothetical protein
VLRPGAGHRRGGQRPATVRYRARGVGQAAPPPAARVPTTPGCYGTALPGSFTPSVHVLRILRESRPARRVLVSRKWSGKTLADHRADRKAWLTGMLGLPATDPSRYTWEPVKPDDPDHMPTGQRLLHVVADRIQWQTALEQARRRAAEADPPATERAA